MSSSKIIALMGKARSGKDTFGQMLLQANPDGVRVAFADKLKEICGEMFELSDEDMNTEAGKARNTELRCLTCPICKSVNCHEVKLDRETKIACRDCSAVGELASFKGFWSPRMILQYIGTEGFRRVDSGVWVRYALRTAKNALTHGVEVTKADAKSVHKAGQRFVPQYVFITDCRFRSEMAGVVAAGGEVWRIRRPETDAVSTGLKQHASETEMDSIPDSEFHRVIENTGTLEDLQLKASTALAQFIHGRI